MFGFKKTPLNKTAALQQPQRASPLNLGGGGGGHAPSKPPQRGLNAAAPQTNNFTTVRSIEQFSSLDLPFEGLIKTIPIGAHLLYRVCPVLFGGKENTAAARACVLVTKEYVGSKELQMVKAAIADPKKGAWEVWSKYDYIVVPDQVLLPIVRGAIGRDALKQHRAIANSSVDSGLRETFKKVVAWAVNENVSDIHFNIDNKSQNSNIFFTINGRYVKPAEWEMPTSTLLEMMRVAYMTSSAGNGPGYDPTIEQQCRIDVPFGDGAVMLRWASMACDYPGPSVATRLIKLEAGGQIKPLQELSYLPSQIRVFRRAMNSEKGAIVIVGVVGSGKTHTLASLCSAIPPWRKKMGGEDPVELIIPGMLQKSISRGLEGGSENPFESFLNTIKRSGMHDVLLGEIRDEHTGAAFMDLVSSGTSVYTTTHAPSAVGAFDKLAGDTVKVSRDFLSAPGHIKLITYQALIPKSCPNCALGFDEFLTQRSEKLSLFDSAYFNRIEALYGLDVKRIRMRNPDGCSRCRHASLPELNGFAGREMVAEQIEPNDIMLEMVKRADSVGLNRYFAGLRTSEFDHEDMTGKTAMECAVYKMSCGLIDPREIEPRFHDFETEQMRRGFLKKTSFYAPITPVSHPQLLMPTAIESAHTHA